jgi:hypothetical protein
MTDVQQDTKGIAVCGELRPASTTLIARTVVAGRGTRHCPTWQPPRQMNNRHWLV